MAGPLVPTPSAGFVYPFLEACRCGPACSKVVVLEAAIQRLASKEDVHCSALTLYLKLHSTYLFIYDKEVMLWWMMMMMTHGFNICVFYLCGVFVCVLMWFVSEEEEEEEESCICDPK